MFHNDATDSQRLALPCGEHRVNETMPSDLGRSFHAHAHDQCVMIFGTFQTFLFIPVDLLFEY